MTLLSFKDIDHFIKQFNFDKTTSDLACLTITDIFNRYCPTLNWYLKEIYRLSYTMGPKKYSRKYIFKIDSKDINWQTVKGVMTINTNVDSDSEQCGEHSFFFRDVRLIEKVGSMRKLDDTEFVITPKPLVKEVSQSFTDIEKKIIKALYGEEAVKSDFYNAHQKPASVDSPLDWEGLRKDMEHHPIKHVSVEHTLPTEETSHGFPFIPRADKPLSMHFPMDKLLSGELSIIDLALLMPANPFPKTNIRQYLLMRLLETTDRDKKKPFGNFKIKKITRRPPTN